MESTSRSLDDGDLEVVCVGESMAMITPERPEPLEFADSVIIRAAGAESNVAIYLAGLGHRVGWVSRLGDDPLGRRVLREINEIGVDTSLVQVDLEAPTGVFFKDPSLDSTSVFYYRRGSAASKMDVSVLEHVFPRPPLIAHMTGITPALSKSCDALMSEAFSRFRASGTSVSFDVNYREGLWSRSNAGPRLLELAQLSDVVFVGLDEAETLWGVTTPEEIRTLIHRPRSLVMKDGSVGATVFHEEGSEFVPALEVKVLEVVGAGDAFAAGWLSGLLRGLTQIQRLRLGHLMAGSSLSSTGDHRALPAGSWLETALLLSDSQWSMVRPDFHLENIDARDLLESISGG
jgi:2-dehydro-3-deoxygluconokinase